MSTRICESDSFHISRKAHPISAKHWFFFYGPISSFLLSTCATLPPSLTPWVAALAQKTSQPPIRRTSSCGDSEPKLASSATIISVTAAQAHIQGAMSSQKCGSGTLRHPNIYGYASLAPKVGTAPIILSSMCQTHKPPQQVPPPTMLQLQHAHPTMPQLPQQAHTPTMRLTSQSQKTTTSTPTGKSKIPRTMRTSTTKIPRTMTLTRTIRKEGSLEGSLEGSK